MKKIMSVLSILSIFFTVSIVTASTEAGKKLFESNCGKCHSLERSLSVIKDLEGWSRTVSRMIKYINENTAFYKSVTREEADKISRYLADRETAAFKKPGEGPGVLEEHGMFEFKKVSVDQFIEPSVCGKCHTEIFEQWSGSMHSKSFSDPIWQAATKLFVKDAVEPGELLEMKACVKCHTPLGFRAYLITSPEADYDKLAELPAQGIFCNWCHNINEVKHIGDAGYDVNPGGGLENPSTMLGPFKDASSDFHPTSYSELHTRSEFCGLCHNVTHAANRLPIESTYSEWKNSPYNTGDPETSVHCQDCHMRQRPGIPATGKTERPDNPGKAAINGPDRKHIWTHYFVGGNALVTKLMGSEVNAKMAVERLQNAADLELIKKASYTKGGIASVKVKVKNTGAGHYLPTGITEVRQMWLDVMVSDANGRIIFRSGALDKEGNIDDDAVVFFTQLGNAKGEPVMNIALAETVLYDHRVPPKGYVIEKYAFNIPTDAAAPLKVTATLKYRSASQSLANTLLGEKAPQIPVIEMVSISDKIEVK